MESLDVAKPYTKVDFLEEKQNQRKKENEIPA